MDEELMKFASYTKKKREYYQEQVIKATANGFY